MNTQCTITACGKNAKKAVDAAFDEIARIHSLTDFYTETSDVSKINSSVADEEVLVDSATVHILGTALEICQASEGAFDITVAPLSFLWNFGSPDAKIPDENAIVQAKTFVSYNNIKINTENNTVTKTATETKIDLGGAAKGYAADRASSILKSYNITGAIIDLGGNISCIGTNPKSRDKEWRIGIQVPFSPTGDYGKIINLKEGSVVTSGTYQRNFSVDGKLYHHILDPETGYPAERDYNSVTIVSENSLLADCLSTACFVLGKEKGSTLVQKYGAEIYYQ